MKQREIIRAEQILLMSNPLALPRFGSLRELFEQRYVPVPESGCWLWIGNIRQHGYGVLRYQGISEYAHRISYKLFHGPILDKLTIDHLCRVRCCVNPDHLEMVTIRENILRGTSPSAKCKQNTHCKRGHLLIKENLIQIATRPRTRTCRLCSDIRYTQRTGKIRHRKIAHHGCTKIGCNRKYYSLGLCQQHYRRFAYEREKHALRTM